MGRPRRLRCSRAAEVPAKVYPCLGEMLVKDREGNIGEQGRKDPALWRTGARFSKLAVLTEDVRLQERLHQTQHTLVPDPGSHTRNSPECEISSNEYGDRLPTCRTSRRR